MLRYIHLFQTVQDNPGPVAEQAVQISQTSLHYVLPDCRITGNQQQQTKNYQPGIFHDCFAKLIKSAKLSTFVNLPTLGALPDLL
ncbi:MAG TPA: hypothetical protein PLS02_06720 [Bacteroidales bacterium]|nr:hypothetical protein [Bacteroidales bacterium]